MFCVRPHPLTTKGGARFEVGWAPHIRGPGRCFGRFRGGWGCICDFLASICVRICICWLSTDRWWVLTVLGGVSRLFSFLDLGWCEGMVDDGGSGEERVCDV